MYPMPMLRARALMVGITAVVVGEIECTWPIDRVVGECCVLLFESLSDRHCCVPLALLGHHVVPKYYAYITLCCGWALAGSEVF